MIYIIVLLSRCNELIHGKSWEAFWFKVISFAEPFAECIIESFDFVEHPKKYFSFDVFVQLLFPQIKFSLALSGQPHYVLLIFNFL